MGITKVTFSWKQIFLGERQRPPNFQVLYENLFFKRLLHTYAIICKGQLTPGEKSQLHTYLLMNDGGLSSDEISELRALVSDNGKVE